jgi:hypothetical protein
MKTKFNQKITFLIGITLIGLLVSFTTIGTTNKNQDKDPDLMLCVGNHWTEAEGKAFLEQKRQTYTTTEAWEKRAKQIRAQILKGSDLEKFPKKCPLSH